MHQTAIKPQTKLETLRSIYTLVFQKRLTTTHLVTYINYIIKKANLIIGLHDKL